MLRGFFLAFLMVFLFKFDGAENVSCATFAMFMSALNPKKIPQL